MARGPRPLRNPLPTDPGLPSLPTMGFTIRDYTDLDEPSWLRCRVLSFLGSSYFDDVRATRTPFEGDALRLVSVLPRPEGVTTPGEEQVVGILDVELWEQDDQPVATIDTVAVHPDHQRAGIAGALLGARHRPRRAA